MADTPQKVNAAQLAQRKMMKPKRRLPTTNQQSFGAPGGLASGSSVPMFAPQPDLNASTLFSQPNSSSFASSNSFSSSQPAPTSNTFTFGQAQSNANSQPAFTGFGFQSSSQPDMPSSNNNSFGSASTSTPVFTFGQSNSDSGTQASSTGFGANQQKLGQPSMFSFGSSQPSQQSGGFTFAATSQAPSNPFATTAQPITNASSSFPSMQSSTTNMFALPAKQTTSNLFGRLNAAAQAPTTTNIFELSTNKTRQSEPPPSSPTAFPAPQPASQSAVASSGLLIQQPASPNPFASLIASNRASEPPQSSPAFPITANKDASETAKTLPAERPSSPAFSFQTPTAPKFTWGAQSSANTEETPATPAFSFGSPAQASVKEEQATAPANLFAKKTGPSPVKEKATSFVFLPQTQSTGSSEKSAAFSLSPTTQTQSSGTPQSNVFASLIGNATPSTITPKFSFGAQTSQTPQTQPTTEAFKFSSAPLSTPSQTQAVETSKAKPAFVFPSQTVVAEKSQSVNPPASVFSTTSQPFGHTSPSRQNVVNGSSDNDAPAKQSEPVVTNHTNAFEQSAQATTSAAANTGSGMPQQSSFANLFTPSTNNIFSQSSLSQAPPPSPKLANKTLVTADTVLPSIEQSQTEKDNINDVEFLDDAVLKSQLLSKYPGHTPEQREAMLEAMQLRAFNANFAAYLASIPSVADCSSAMRYYLRKIDERHALQGKPKAMPKLKELKPNKEIGLTEGDSRSTPSTNSALQKPIPEQQKTSDATDTASIITQSSTTSLFQPLTPSRANVNGKRNATSEAGSDEIDGTSRVKHVKLNPNTPAVPHTPLTPTTPVTSALAIKSPEPMTASKSKRKAEFQLTKDDPTGEETDGPRTRKIAKPSSETSNRFKSIMDKSDRPIANGDRSPAQTTTPTKVNPFANLVPATAPAAAKTTSKFSFTPITTAKPTTPGIFGKESVGETTMAVASSLSKPISSISTITPKAPVTGFGFAYNVPAQESGSITISNGEFKTVVAGDSASPSTGGFKPTISSASSNSSTKLSSFDGAAGGASSNFLTQFQDNAKRSLEEAEKKALQRAKDEDLDSDDDEAEFEANWRAKRAEEKKALEQAASKSASFIPGKGFVMNDVAKANEDESAAEKSKSQLAVESKITDTTNAMSNQSGTTNGSLFPMANSTAKHSLLPLSTTSTSLFLAHNRSETSSPGPASSTSSIFDSQEVKRPATFDFIPKSTAADDDEDDDDDDDDSTDEDNENGSKDALTTPGVKSDEASALETSTHASTSMFATSTTAPSTFSFTKTSSAENPFSPKSNGVNPFASASKTAAKESNIFASLNKTPAAESTPLKDKTWNQNTPIKFGASPSTQTIPNVDITSTTPDSSASPFAGFGTTPTQKSSIFAGLNANKPATTPFLFGASSNASSLFPSAATSAVASRATTPGPVSDSNSIQDVQDESSTPTANDPDAEHHEQLNLVSTTAGEEEEDILFEARGKAQKYDVESKSWKVKGLGPLKILKHRSTGASRTLLRSDPGGNIVLNRSVLKGIDYVSSGKTVKITTAAENGSGMETWLLQVKTNESATSLAKALEDGK